jgi:hypothetical protein
VPDSSSVQYRMKCRVCGRAFLVADMSSTVPEHQERALPDHPDILYVRCKGSGLRGIVAGTETKTFNDIRHKPQK